MENKQNNVERSVPLETNSSGEDSFQRYYEKETEKWKSKMVEVLGDLHLYNFYTSYGHPDCRFDEDYVGEQVIKTEPFENLHEMSRVDKEAEKQFCEILSEMENKTDASFQQFLQERKKECADVFDQFDKIVALSEKYFELEYSDCQKRAQEQITLQKPMIQEVEKYLSEVEDVGDKEINILKENISNYIRNIGMSWTGKIEEIYEEIYSRPPLIEGWSEGTELITSKDVRCGFLKAQKETAELWKKAFDDLLMLSSELEKYRYNYNMTKSKLERATYWMNRNYRDNMPELTKTQRKIASFADRRVKLYKVLSRLEKEIAMEQNNNGNIELSFRNKIANMKASNNRAIEQAHLKFRQVYDVKKSEMLDILSSILKGDKYIHEEILNVMWNPIDLSELYSENLTKEKFLKSKEISENPEEIKTLYEDEFADAFRVFVFSRDFVKLLSRIAEQLSYVLDFRWVDYVQKTLEIEKEIRWLELFKVFKIDFTEDLKDLKDHMMKFSKKNGEEIVLDINGAVDGFLEFAALKREKFNSIDEDLSTMKSETNLPQELWTTVDEKLPKTLMWENVLELLRKYREMLQSRNRLLTLRSKMAMENEEIEKYLENYYNYDVPKN